MHSLSIRSAVGRFAAGLVSIVLAACGGQDFTTPAQTPAPTIASFAATPATVPAGGGQVTLSWSASDATSLVIDQGVGDVSGSTSKTVMVTTGTTFTLTATNGVGTTSAAAVVTVAAPAAPVISAFTATPATLPAGGGSVTLNWTSTGATTLVIDHGVGDVSGLTSKAVNVATDTTFTLTATNAAGSVTSTTAVTIAVAANRFVDVANGSDANPCTQALPCKSIIKSLTNAPAGSTLALADGTYTQATEGNFSVLVPANVTLRATHPGAVTLANVSLYIPAGATLDGLVMGRTGTPDTNTCASVSATGSTTSTVTLNLVGVFSNCPAWLGIGYLKAVMTPGQLPGGVYTTGLAGTRTDWISVGTHAELLIQGGVIEGNGTTGIAPVLRVTDTAAKLTLDNVILRNWNQPAISSVGTFIVQNGSVIDHVGIPGDPGPFSVFNACSTNSAILLNGASASLTLDHATLSNVASAGICVGDSFVGASQALHIVQSTISNVAGAAIESLFNTYQPDTNGGPTITIDGTSFINTGRAIWWAQRPGTSITLTNSSITGSTAAATTGGGTEACLGAAIRIDAYQEAWTFRMRGTTVANNAAEGVCVVQETQQMLAADLGTAADPGGNTFTGNGAANLRLSTSIANVVNAVGNLWTSSQQGADAGGRYSVPPAYAPVPETGPASGTNFKIDYTIGTLNL